MNLRKPAFPLATAALFFLLALPAIPGAAQMEDVVIKSTKLAEGLLMLEGAGGNLAVCYGKDGVFLVDDQFAPLTQKIRAAITEFSDQPIRFVLNTHWHGDHTGGNENLAGEGSLIIAHENVRRRMGSEQFSQIWQRSTPASPDTALPVVTFNDAVSFHLNDQEIRAFHVPPAHTDGDAVVHFVDANVVHTGDILFNGLYPFIDADSGGSIDGVIVACDLCLKLCDDSTRIIPGHGPLASPDDLRSYRDMLKVVRDRVAAAIEAGEALEEIQAAHPTREYDEEWGGGFLSPDDFVKIVYHGLSG